MKQTKLKGVRRHGHRIEDVLLRFLDLFCIDTLQLPASIQHMRRWENPLLNVFVLVSSFVLSKYCDTLTYLLIGAEFTPFIEVTSFIQAWHLPIILYFFLLLVSLYSKVSSSFGFELYGQTSNCNSVAFHENTDPFSLAKHDGENWHSGGGITQVYSRFLILKRNTNSKNLRNKSNQVIFH